MITKGPHSARVRDVFKGLEFIKAYVCVFAVNCSVLSLSTRSIMSEKSTAKDFVGGMLASVPSGSQPLENHVDQA